MTLAQRREISRKVYDGSVTYGYDSSAILLEATIEQPIEYLLKNAVQFNLVLTNTSTQSLPKLNAIETGDITGIYARAVGSFTLSLNSRTLTIAGTAARPGLLFVECEDLLSATATLNTVAAASGTSIYGMMWNRENERSQTK